MKRKCLVVRVPAENDRRQVYLELTDSGTAILEKLVWAHREELRNMTVQFNQMSGYLHQEE